MTIQTFNRYEIKYMLNPQQFEAIQSELARRMVLDSFCTSDGKYTIYNLYFDTEDSEIIRHSLSKPYYREKLRLRSYTMPTGDEDLVFLELKKKIGGIVAKRRAIMAYGEAAAFIDEGKIPQTEHYQDRQVVGEIAAFLNRYDGTIKPRMYLSYERIAFFDKGNPDLRMSFDQNLLTRRTQVNLLDGDFGHDLLEDDQCLMEIKCAGQIPLWLCSLLSEWKLYKTTFSKYGEEYKRYAKQKVRVASGGNKYAGSDFYEHHGRITDIRHDLACGF